MARNHWCFQWLHRGAVAKTGAGIYVAIGGPQFAARLVVPLRCFSALWCFQRLKRRSHIKCMHMYENYMHDTLVFSKDHIRANDNNMHDTLVLSNGSYMCIYK